jgi:hypothetical protein
LSVGSIIISTAFVGFFHERLATADSDIEPFSLNRKTIQSGLKYSLDTWCFFLIHNTDQKTTSFDSVDKLSHAIGIEFGF